MTLRQNVGCGPQCGLASPRRPSCSPRELPSLTSRRLRASSTRRPSRHALIRQLVSGTPASHQALLRSLVLRPDQLKMSEERSKISLRSGTRKKRRPEISAPRQISKPIAQDGAVRVPAGATDAGPRPRPRPPAAGGKVRPRTAEAHAE